MADESRNVLVVTFDDSSEFAKMFICVCVCMWACVVIVDRMHLLSSDTVGGTHS